MSSHGPRCETKILQRNGACCGRESGLVHAGAPPLRRRHSRGWGETWHKNRRHAATDVHPLDDIIDVKNDPGYRLSLTSPICHLLWLSQFHVTCHCGGYRFKPQVTRYRLTAACARARLQLTRARI